MQEKLDESFLLAFRNILTSFERKANPYTSSPNSSSPRSLQKAKASPVNILSSRVLTSISSALILNAIEIYRDIGK